jgi:hypothetical protein
VFDGFTPCELSPAVAGFDGDVPLCLLAFPFACPLPCVEVAWPDWVELEWLD